MVSSRSLCTKGRGRGGGRDGRVFGFIKNITYHWAGCQVSSGSYNSFGDSHRKQGEQRRINISLHVDKQGTVCINISLNFLSSVSTRTHSDRYELLSSTDLWLKIIIDTAILGGRGELDHSDRKNVEILIFWSVFFQWSVGFRNVQR